MKRVWVVAVAAVLVLAACSSDRSSSTPPTTASEAARPGIAERTAEDLLGHVVVPAGATHYSGPLPKALQASFSSTETPNLVDEHRAWIVRESTARVLAFVRAHAPAGLVLSGQGDSGRIGASLPTACEVTFDEKSIPFVLTEDDPIATETVIVELAARTATTTWVRADAQAVWRPRRDPATLVPGRDLAITVGRSVIDRLDETAGLVLAFDALPPTVPGPHSCPAQTGPGLTIAFSTRAGAQPDVRAVYTCDRLEVTAHGHHQELEAGTFVADALKRATKG